MSETFKPDISQPKGRVQFFKSTSAGPRDWGQEILAGLIPESVHLDIGATLKLLKYNKGHAGGVQYHHYKFECGYVLSGQLMVRYDKGDGKLSERICEEGDIVFIPPGAVHQEEALSDNLVVIELSSAHKNDRVRVEHLYGLPEATTGLPSTTRGQVGGWTLNELNKAA